MVSARIEEITIQHELLFRMVANMYSAVGMVQPDAEAVARIQVETDLRGVFSHGTRATPGYCKGITDGNINARPKIDLVRETAAMALLDGDKGLGHVASLCGMEIAIEKARAVGVGTVAVRNSNHFGPAAYYAMMAVPHNMIGFATTSTGGPSVAAYGSSQAAVGNNPLAWAIPTRNEPPVVLDMACGVSAWGRLSTMRLYGQRLTTDWALDADGRPTDDPAAARIMLPAGGAKGYGLAFVCSALAGPLAGGVMPIHKKRSDPFAQSTEHFFYTIAIEAFVDLDTFFEEVDRSIADIRAVTPAEGFERVYLPGEIEWLKAQRWRKEGIPLHREHVKALQEMARELGIKEEVAVSEG